MVKKITVLALSMALIACVTKRDKLPDEEEALAQKLRNLKTDGPRKRILVLPVINESAEKDPAVSKTARDVILSGLKLTDNFIVVDNGDLPKDVASLNKNGNYDLDELSKAAQELGVIAILDGRVTEVRANKIGEEVGLLRQVRADVTVTGAMHVYSPFSKKEVYSDSRTARSSEKNYRVLDPDGKRTLSSDPMLIHEALTKVFDEFVPPIARAVDKLSWTGRIAYVRGEKIYLNAGRMTGLNVGDILKVYDVGDDIFDPETGLLIGKAPGRVKGTLEVISYFGKDGAVTIVHSGSGFKENDTVELY